MAKAPSAARLRSRNSGVPVPRPLAIWARSLGGLER